LFTNQFWEIESEKKGTKRFDLPQWGFEPLIFEQIFAHDLNFEGD
jgi:hypothetical protein